MSTAKDPSKLLPPDQVRWVMGRVQQRSIEILKGMANARCGHAGGPMPTDMREFVLRCVVRDMLKKPREGEDIETLKDSDAKEIARKIGLRLRSLTPEQQRAFVTSYGQVRGLKLR